MKKSLICVAAVAAMMCTAVTSYATGSYSPTNNSAAFTEAEGKSTVIFYKVTDSPTSDNIVYVNQASGVFGAATDFLLKDNAAEGAYTVKFGGSTDTPETSTFNIGMTNSETDVKLEQIDGALGYSFANEKYNIGYKGTVDLSKGYKSLIIKKGNTYMGCQVPTGLNGTGSAEVGIQINGVSGTLNDTTLTPEIDGVWLSTRGIETAADAQ